MANLPKNLPAILRKHGLKVVEIDGWEDRGRPGPFAPVGVLCHHTAGHDGIGDPGDDLAYVKNVLVKGRPDLEGPLCQLALSAEGVVYIVAAGRANHAGDAKKSGTVAAGNGNSLYIGIEAMNAGNGKDVWEKSQYDAYVLLCAVLSVEVTKNSHATVRAHRETSVTGKIDPAGPTPYEKTFDMTKFRTRVKAKMEKIKAGGTAAPKPQPKPAPAPTGFSGKGELRVGFHNIKAGDGPKVGRTVADVEKHLTAILKEEKPDVMFLAEAKDMHGQLAFVGKLGYTARQQAPKARFAGHVSESANIAILLRNGVELKINKLIPQDIGFRGPKAGIMHDPRVHRYVVVNKDSVNWPVAGIHGPFGDGPVKEMVALLVDWIKDEVAAHGRAVIVGDWNLKAPAVTDRVAKPAGAKVDGAGIDLAVYRGCTKTDGENLGLSGSDHDAKVWTFKK